MARMGRDDMRAALIYQRATSDDERIADRLSDLVDRHRTGGTGRTTDDDDGVSRSAGAHSVMLLGCCWESG
ncbi:MAG TPA: hypothetical protein VJT49_23415 [Amycolatopsis sp.]|uniref:hypothetical protein n=1 Tax=Amycolatopsis sp. TaxID=37632 RepID=UPI002B48407B|nr:hypothetical protein [Amycolatopsis sp.]HKS48005.1 hypothetical protein [Amycolatopsis sp.]